MHAKRWLTGVIALPVLIVVIGFGPRWLFHAFLSLAGIIGLAEFFRISPQRLPPLLRYAVILLSLCLFLFASRGDFYFIPAVVFFWAVLPLSFFMFSFRSSNRDVAGGVSYAVLGPVYVCLPLCLLVIIDRFPHGNLWIFFLLAVIFSSDTGAFYFGRAFGRHKLHASVSPGKTWEGAVGGTLCSVAAAFLFPLLVPLYDSSAGILVLAVLLSVFGQIGDLAESMLKRQYGVKDSGAILPGHGGLLDRIDGLLFAIPVLYVYLACSI